MAKYYRHTATIHVPPHTRFPIDMLRYDGCSPRTEQDANRIEKTFEHWTQPTEIEVEKLSHTKDAAYAWTAERWASFAVKLTPGDVI